MALKEPTVSPCITALRQAVKNGDRHAVERFWQEMGANGTPLVEPITDNAQWVLVTCLCRAARETRNVVVVGGLAGLDFILDRITSIPNADGVIALLGQPPPGIKAQSDSRERIPND